MGLKQDVLSFFLSESSQGGSLVGRWVFHVRDSCWSLRGKGITPLTRASSCRADGTVSALLTSRASPNASRGCWCSWLTRFLFPNGCFGKEHGTMLIWSWKLEVAFFFCKMFFDAFCFFGCVALCNNALMWYNMCFQHINAFGCSRPENANTCEINTDHVF